MNVKCAALAVLLAVAGCSGGATGEQQTTRAAEPAARASEVRVPLLPSGGGTHLVGAPGVLEVDGPCLYLRAPDGTRTLPVFATANTRWNPFQGWLEVGERTFRAGQHVMLGGSPVRTLEPTLPWVQAPDPRCDVSGAFIAYTVTARE